MRKIWTIRQSNRNLFFFAQPSGFAPVCALALRLCRCLRCHGGIHRNAPTETIGKAKPFKSHVDPGLYPGEAQDLDNQTKRTGALPKEKRITNKSSSLRGRASARMACKLANGRFAGGKANNKQVELPPWQSKRQNGVQARERALCRRKSE